MPQKKKNKSKEPMREDTKNMNRDEGGEGDEGVAQKESTHNRQSNKKKERKHGASDWNIWGVEEATQQRSPPDWNIRGDASRQAHGARTGTSGEERTGRQQNHPDWNIRGAEARDGNTRRRREWTLKGASSVRAEQR